MLINIKLILNYIYRKKLPRIERVPATNPTTRKVGINSTEEYSKIVIGCKSFVVIFLSVAARLRKNGAIKMSKYWKKLESKVIVANIGNAHTISDF